MNNILPKWWQVYSNDEEKKLFVGKDGASGLCRKTSYDWRSTDLLAKESGLTKIRVEEILDKYHKIGIVLQHKTDPEKWGYWENVAPSLGKGTPAGVVKQDQDKRVEKADKKKNGTTPTIVAAPASPPVTTTPAPKKKTLAGKP